MFEYRFLPLACSVLLLTGCASSIQRWIVNTRVHQGDVSLARGDSRDAALGYKLALRIDPNDAQARAGYVQAAAQLARSEYLNGNFDDATATVNGGLAVDPQSAALLALRGSIDQAKLKREIVVSNYPTYRVAGVEIQHAYAQLDTANALLLRDLRRFGYTYDADDLTSAIKRSYELELELSKNTNRLVLYRQLVSSGIPEVPSEATTFGASSLLPLP
jgi:hypothetical protein